MGSGFESRVVYQMAPSSKAGGLSYHLRLVETRDTNWDLSGQNQVTW